jgi:hypothetical protein
MAMAAICPRENRAAPAPGDDLIGGCAEFRGCRATGLWLDFPCAMNFPNFLRVEREQRDGSRHYVVHTNDPKFTMELAPDAAAPDKIGSGVMKRLHVPNSWAGDYTRYAKFITAAQEFFRESFAEPAPKTETKRFVR